MDLAVEKKLPDELVQLKRRHYRDVFEDRWETVFAQANTDLEALVLRDKGEILGGCALEKGTYVVHFEDFALLPRARGKGAGRVLMTGLEELARHHHETLMTESEKPQDIQLMYLESLVYVDFDIPDLAAMQFSPFLRTMGFLPCAYNESDRSAVDRAGIQVYQAMYPDFSLAAFRKVVINDGVRLKNEAQDELLALNPRQWSVVLKGLNVKLGHYNTSQRVSYRYDLCPVCEDMGSSEQDSESCKRCYIHTTCMEPFREVGRFKEDHEVSAAYFGEARRFMLSHQPAGLREYLHPQ